MFGPRDDFVELWNTSKHKTLQAAKELIEERPRSKSYFASGETQEKIEKSRSAMLPGNQDHYRDLSRKIRAHLKRDNGRYVRSLSEDVEGHFNANYLRPTY